MAGDKKNARHQAIRTLTKMIDDLRSMRRALGVDREGFDEKGDRKGDDFLGYKSELNDKLRGVRSNIEKLNEMRKKLGGERDPTLIALQLKNTKDLKSCIDSLNKLKSVCDADEKKTGKKALEPAEIHDRRKYLTLLAKEIEDLSEGNSTVKMNLSADEQLMADKKEKRLEEQRKEREAKRAERRKGRERRKGKGEAADADDVELKPVPSNAPTEQELAFYDKVNENMADQDQMLDEISGGLAEIKQLALKAQKELAVQEKLLDQVDEKMDNVNNQFKSANQRLADLLEQTGGMSRWCPIIVLGILFVALLGYIFYIRN